MAKSSKPLAVPIRALTIWSEIFHFVKYLYPLVYWIGDINFVGRRIDCDRSRIVKLAVTISGAAPDCQHLSIGTKFSDAIVALIDDIN